MKRIGVLFIMLVMITLFASCSTDGSDNNVSKEQDNALSGTRTVETEINVDNTKHEEDAPSRKRSDLLPNTHKIPKQEIYVDTPNFNDIEKGYTELFKDGETKYVAFTDLRNETVSDEKEAFELIYPKFKKNVSSWHRINGETFTSTELVEINGISAQRVTGTVEYGALDKYDCYLYGYGFVFEGIPCAIIGVVSDLDQPQEEIDSVTAIVDAMMESVRNEQ